MLAEQLRLHGQAVEIINSIQIVLEDTILIYPEIILGNPCDCRQVVRWALKDNIRAGPKDQIWSWSVAFLEALNRIPGRNITDEDVLQLPLVEMDIFNNDNPQPREGVVFYKADHLRGVEDLREIMGNWPDKRQELADLLRRSEYLICGKMSLLMDEARFCGCPSVTFGWERPKRTDWGLEGICWSMEELAAARREVNEALPKYIAYHADLPERIERFIDRTQKGWN